MVECQLPKLDVAGSSPVSRSMFSITYPDSLILSRPLNGVKWIFRSPKLFILKTLLIRMPAAPAGIQSTIESIGKPSHGFSTVY